MTQQQLATIVDWVGTLRGRTRLQIVVYLLRRAGCQIGDTVTLRSNQPPYSRKVADNLDAMVSAGLLVETVDQYDDYSYQLTNAGRQQLLTQPPDASLQAHRQLCQRLSQLPISQLRQQITVTLPR